MNLKEAIKSHLPPPWEEGRMKLQEKKLKGKTAHRKRKLEKGKKKNTP